ncbi:MAG: hypothetical protein ACLUIQ_05840 [Dialister invisus]
MVFMKMYAMASVVGGIVICVLYPLTGIVYASWGGFGAVSSPCLCDLFRVEALSSRKDTRRRGAGIKAGKVF